MTTTNHITNKPLKQYENILNKEENTNGNFYTKIEQYLILTPLKIFC